MKFEGIIYEKTNPYYKVLGYFGLLFFVLAFSMIFFGGYFSELEERYSWFKSTMLLTLLLSIISYFIYHMTPKYGLFNTVEEICKISMDNEAIIIGQHIFKKIDIEYLEFMGKDYQYFSGGVHTLFSSDGSKNKILIRTENKETVKKFLIDNEKSFNHLSGISKKWKAEGVNIKASFDLV